MDQQQKSTANTNTANTNTANTNTANTNTANTTTPNTVSSQPAETPEQRELLDTLFVELFQTERSAIAHPEREGERYGSTPPGQALLAIATHAKAEFPKLEQLSLSDDHRMAKVGAVAGELFSTVRDAVVDRMISVEKSYRGTLIGLHHGLDLVALVRYLAKEMGNDALASWCKHWGAERRPLVESAQRELVWFAQNPAIASSKPHKGLIAAGETKS